MTFTILGKQERIGYICAILAAVMFGSVSTIAKPLTSSVNPLLLASSIYLVSAATLTPFAHKSSYKSATKKDYLLVLAISISGAVIAPSLYFVGLHHASASDAALLSNGEGLFTVLLAMLFFKERIKPVGYVAVAIILIGLFIVTTDLKTTTLPQIHFEDMLIQQCWPPSPSKASERGSWRTRPRKQNIARINKVLL